MNAGDSGEGSIMVTPFGVEVSGAPTAPVVIVTGEIDVATSPQLRTQLNSLVERGATDITLEFGGRHLGSAVLEAALVELPLAAICFWVAGDAERAVANALTDGAETAAN